MQTAAAARMNNVRSAVLVALGIEFTRSHGLEYAKGLLEMLGADDETIRHLVQRVIADGILLARSHPVGSSVQASAYEVQRVYTWSLLRPADDAPAKK